MSNLPKLKFKNKKYVMNFLKLNPEYALKLFDSVFDTEHVYFDVTTGEHMFYMKRKFDQVVVRETLNQALDLVYPNRFELIPVDTINKKQESES